MRVLAIRGHNLTSLAGTFEVDFDAEPLSSAGIFAITGPTGAGKSTLLDAICLALFNHVPRLASAARGQVGAADGEKLAADDPRALLRHRATEGYAEVDFIGVDRGRYRARWYVKRARLRSDGSLQNVQQTFTNLDTGHVYGGTRTETLNAIKDKIGLTAQQFGRAVMLAQGEFNAFIDADSNTRAELLEKLTGTDLYARLGIAARAKAERLREGLNAIEMRIGAQNGLDDIQRAKAEERLSKASVEHETAREVLAARERDRSWHTLATELAARVEAAEEARRAANLKQTEAEPRRTGLASRRVAFAIVPTWQAVIDAEAKLSATQRRISALEEAVTQARGRETEARSADACAAETLRIAEAALEQERPNLEAARNLDGRIAELNDRLRPLSASSGAAAEAVEASAAHLSTATKDFEQATTQRLALADWLERNRTHGTLVARRDDLAADITEHAELTEQTGFLEAGSVALATRLSDAQTLLAEDEAGAGLARAALAAAEQNVEIARSALPTSDITEGIERTRDGLNGVEPLLLAFERADAELARLNVELDEDRAELSRLDREIEASDSRRGEIDAALPDLEARHAEAARSGALSAAASGDAAERLRGALVEGQPCPVCGGTDHVVAALTGLLDGRAADDAARVAELANDLSALGRERAILLDRILQSGIRRTAASERIAGGGSAIAAASVQRDGASTTLRAALRKCAIDEDPGSQDVRGAVSARLRAVETDRARFARARDDEKVAATALDAARSAAASADEKERAAALAVRDLEVEVRRAADRLGEIIRRRDQVATSLDGSLGQHFDWRDDAAAVATLDGFVVAWREKTLELQTIDTALPERAKSARDAAIVHGQQTIQLDAATTAEQAASQELDRLVLQRVPLLGGEAVTDVTDRVTKAVEAASAAREAARVAFDGARSVATAAAASHGQAVKSLELDQGDTERRRLSLEGELATKQVGIDLVERVATEGEAALDAEAVALAAIERAVVVAETELHSRIGDREAHISTEAPVISLDALGDALNEATAAEAATRSELSDTQMVIRQDDKAREATAALRRTLEVDRVAAHPWFQLDSLIGDATGAKFRRYAQGLTLERLLLHANARLGELKPRYSLERAPGSEMLVQVVDHDMAGEIRGLPNLSGGERFLVSLALALGLSEMSTGQGLRVESLFIDEGFGALDSASLGQAIGVLEQLHATGRRVGVISHIEEVKERIAVKIAVVPASKGSSIVEVQGS